MDPTRYIIRPFLDADFEPAARIWNRLNPRLQVSVDEFRQWDRVLEAPGLFKRLLAVQEITSGEVVGTGSVSHAPESFHPDRYWIEVTVEAAHQRHGIGLELYRALEEILTSRRARVVWSGVWADEPRAKRFFDLAGFVETRRTWVSRLDLKLAPPRAPEKSVEEWASEGLQFTTVVEEGPEQSEVRERVYRLISEAEEDVPRMGPATALSFEQFLEVDFGGPGFLPEAMFLAREGDQYVAFTSLQNLPSDLDTLRIGFTGTLRTHRRRGIASELKRQAVEYARKRGYHYLRTGNDSENKPIWAINERLGFRPEHIRIMGEKGLTHLA